MRAERGSSVAASESGRAVGEWRTRGGNQMRPSDISKRHRSSAPVATSLRPIAAHPFRHRITVHRLLVLLSLASTAAPRGRTRRSLYRASPGRGRGLLDAGCSVGAVSAFAPTFFRPSVRFPPRGRLMKTSLIARSLGLWPGSGSSKYIPVFRSAEIFATSKSLPMSVTPERMLPPIWCERSTCLPAVLIPYVCGSTRRGTPS